MLLSNWTQKQQETTTDQKRKKQQWKSGKLSFEVNVAAQKVRQGECVSRPEKSQFDGQRVSLKTDASSQHSWNGVSEVCARGFCALDLHKHSHIHSRICSTSGRAPSGMWMRGRTGQRVFETGGSHGSAPPRPAAWSSLGNARAREKHLWIYIG